MLDDDVKKYIDKSVLCWLATVDEHNVPNVSPKEMFTYDNDDHTLLVANIASPNSIKNLRKNPNVCVSFVDVFVQKGYKIKGIAEVITKNDSKFYNKHSRLTDLFSDTFQIHSIIEITIQTVEPIRAPSYVIFPETTTEQTQVQNALETYKVTLL